MNKLFYILFAGFTLLSIGSCKKNNLVVGKNITAPAFVKIGTLSNTDTVGTYIIKSNNAPFKIPIGITNISDKDRTIQFAYSSPTAVQGQQYTAPTSMIIKAGKALDSLEITGIFAGYPSVTQIDKLTITISGGDIPVSNLKFNYILTMKKYWEADLNAFAGVYINQDYFGGAPDGGPYEVTINPISINGPTSYINIIGLWGFDQPPVKVNLDWNNLETGITTVPKANWFVHPTYGQATINPAGTGTFSTTNKTITIIYETIVAAGSFGKETSVMVKK